MWICGSFGVFPCHVSYSMDIWIRDGHADIFGDAHVGYSAILSDNAEVDADIRIRMAIPNDNGLVEDNDRQLTLA